MQEVMISPWTCASPQVLWSQLLSPPMSLSKVSPERARSLCFFVPLCVVKNLRKQVAPLITSRHAASSSHRVHARNGRTAIAVVHYVQLALVTCIFPHSAAELALNRMPISAATLATSLSAVMADQIVAKHGSHSGMLVLTPSLPLLLSKGKPFLRRSWTN